jgi:predicted DNA-binding protein
MSKIRKTFRITQEQQAKLERLKRASGQTESEIIRQALEAIAESKNKIILDGTVTSLEKMKFHTQP